MSSNKPSICLICDKEGLIWVPVLVEKWKIKYLFCSDEKLKNYFVDTFGLYGTNTNTSNNVLKYLEELNDGSIDLLFLALSTNKFHELILEYVINKKRFFYIFSSNLPTVNVQKLEKFRTLLNNFNANTDIIYDVKKEFKDMNKQFYWNIFNPLLNERVFYSLKNALNELGHTYAVQIESTFIPFSLENAGIENILFYRAILIISLIQFLFEEPKTVFAKCYYIKNEQVTINCLSGNVLFDSLNCYFNLSVHNISKIFSLKVYGENGFIDVSYDKEHSCFQMQRCLNHYEYPNLFVEDSHRNALNELKYFLEEQLYTNKYVNSYINAMNGASCLWKSDGENIPLKEKENCNPSKNSDDVKAESPKKCVVT
ncbi:conserved Plasmodium protein, unknown function [Plasmodium ovale]|uniref:Uncharacterized protein n=1 Tax=Plasmodium ovale TaxID=36330 RepID=A0A1D3UAQ8_PLAOA|nr:conserved Plasmodium protein, unknown function [Plasmodium ovale]